MDAGMANTASHFSQPTTNRKCVRPFHWSSHKHGKLKWDDPFIMKAVSPSSLSRLNNSNSHNVNHPNENTAMKSTPKKRPLTVATPHSINNSIRLRSPKGSVSSLYTKRNTGLSWFERWYRLCSKPKAYFFYVVPTCILFLVAFLTLQKVIVSSSTLTITSIDGKNFETTSILPGLANTAVDLISISAFDSALHHVIPKSMYLPKSSNPISVIYIGRSWQPYYRKSSTDTTFDEDIILDALQRSAYTTVVGSYMYSSNNVTHPMHLVYQQQYHSFRDGDAKLPIVFVVDWSALRRDCHLLQRILHHIFHSNTSYYYYYGSASMHHPNHNVYMLLLDSSASSQAIICRDAKILKHLIPNVKENNIRLAKRSIVTNRRYNYTKQWIEPGFLIPNPTTTMISKNDEYTHNNNNSIHFNNHILHWSGFVSQSFVQLLRIAVNDYATRSENRRWRRQRQKQYNNHMRPIDVTHYWKSASVDLFVKDEYQYYYNHLRQTVQHQINITRVSTIKQQHGDDENTKHTRRLQQQEDKNTLPRWVEFVGIDAEVEFVQSDSSADGTGMNDKDHDDEGDMEISVRDASLARSSVHVAVLASSKIVVVTQADEYEDHDSRLFEALASGAMVLCDTMMASPSGLVHKTNVVFFNSTAKLDQYLQFYLDPKNDLQRQEIARHGLEYALGRHRSWHVLEALLFGKALTRTDKHPLMDDAPKIRTMSVNYTDPVLISL